MEIHFSLDTASNLDRKALAAIAAVYAPASDAATAAPGPNARELFPSMANGDAAALDTVGPTGPEEAEEATPAPAKRTRRTKAQMEADRAAEAALQAAAEEPDEEAAEEAQENTLDAEEEGADDEDVLGTGPTLEDAVKAAGALLNDGRKEDVLKVLATFKAPRVSNLAPDQLGPFIQALKALPAK